MKSAKTEKPAAGTRAQRSTARGSLVTPVRPVKRAKITFYSSSEAMENWTAITAEALKGKEIAIRVGDRAVLLTEVPLSYAEQEYNITDSEIHAKAARIEAKALREIDSSRSRRIV